MLPLVLCTSDFECSENLQTLLLVFSTSKTFSEGTLFTVMFTLGSWQMASCYLLLYCTEYSEVFKAYTVHQSRFSSCIILAIPRYDLTIAHYVTK